MPDNFIDKTQSCYYHAHMSSDDPTKKLPDEVDSVTPGADPSGVDTEGFREWAHELNENFRSLRGLIQSLDEKVDARLRDTRPIWESVQAQLTEIRNDLHRLDRKFDLLHEDVTNVRIKQRDLEDRIDKLERKPS